jgi:hypothetical protein
VILMGRCSAEEGYGTSREFPLGHWRDTRWQKAATHQNNLEKLSRRLSACFSKATRAVVCGALCSRLGSSSPERTTRSRAGVHHGRAVRRRPRARDRHPTLRPRSVSRTDVFGRFYRSGDSLAGNLFSPSHPSWEIPPQRTRNNVNARLAIDCVAVANRALAPGPETTRST